MPDGPAADGPVRRALDGLELGDRVRVEESPVGEPTFPLTPDEERRLSGAVGRRRRELATGRRLATLACAGWGLPRPSLVPDHRGAPAWPAGFVGSITHSDTWAAAAVARRDEVASVGVDVEPAEPLPADVVGVVLTARERREGTDTWADDVYVGCADRLVFCAKEAVYKAWYPLVGGRLDFADVEVALRSDGRWRARGTGSGAAVRWTGGWAVHHGVAAAAVVVPVGAGERTDGAVTSRRPGAVGRFSP